MFLVILALVAFVIGAGMGVSLSFDDGDDGQEYRHRDAVDGPAEGTPHHGTET